ncbi:hypothetical protein TrCOL_g12176 [Triparma columacea]|uniref:TFIIF beta subunit HTH domain-containing protein n=1 Tax=Triparma columacea TaxID=722753 RepID=A0A9W7G4Y1_9STRA|nr:hypothetical protein TrCOL_g12176 [Triparma columacea]
MSSTTIANGRRQQKRPTFDVTLGGVGGLEGEGGEYSIESLAKCVPGTVYPFTSSSDRSSTSIKGVVVRTGALRPVHNRAYSEKMRTRQIGDTIKERVVRSIEATDLPTRTTIAVDGEGGFGQQVASHNQNVKKVTTVITGDIRDVVFSLFSTQDYWPIKEMVRKSNRNEKEIREVLESIAKYERGGENRGTWRLLEEYR